MSKITKINYDPFEQAFNDYFAGNKDVEVIVHSNKGDDEIMPVKYFFRSFDEMPHLEKTALKLCAGKVLDIGAGSGCHSLVLKSRGMDVTSLDIKKGFSDIMIKRGLQKVIHSDIFNYNSEKYDTLLMLMNGIGFTQNLNGLEKFFSHSKNLLKPGGQIIMDSSDLLYLYKEEDGSIRINLNEDYYGEIEYQVEYRGVFGNSFKWLFVDFSTLTEYADKMGFRCELIYEGKCFEYLARLY